MFCPHCHNKIPDGSNICPLCYSNLAGLKMQQSAAPKDPSQPQEKAAPARKSSKGNKKPAYTKGSRGGKKNTDKTPMIIAFGLIVILIVIIALIVKSMFGAGDAPKVQPTSTPVAQQQSQNAQAGNFIVFGATATPAPRVEVTPTPAIQVTPTPAPVEAKTYVTLRKGDEGPDVVTLQQALAELGYLTGAADGNFGTGTQTAVKKFQEDNNLDADGIAGKMTQEALFAKSSVTPIPDATVGPDDIMDLPG
ncbi:MAG: peptidoglycan-binding protein [Clostridia bacterium]|nr:peptidoglycan-binding protein [Clostridia bacterium]